MQVQSVQKLVKNLGKDNSEEVVKWLKENLHTARVRQSLEDNVNDMLRAQGAIRVIDRLIRDVEAVINAKN